MRASWLTPSSVVALVCAGTVGACAAAGTPGFTGTTGDEGGSSATSSTGTQSTGTQGMGGSGVMFDSGTNPDSGTSSILYAYAHTNLTLFQLNLTSATLSPTQIGNFDCIGGTGQDTAMTDLAVNEAGELWAVSNHNFYQLALPATPPGTVHCASTKALTGGTGNYFYGLTFAPVGTVSPTAEVLVGADSSGALWAIDSSTGAVTQHGSFGDVPATGPWKYPGTPWQLSGNIVFLANGTSGAVGFATVRDCPKTTTDTGCNTTDTLIEIDTTLLQAGTQVVTKLVRGQVVKSATCNDPNNASGYGSMFGIAAYGSNVYGFSHSGSIVQIDNNDGTACLVLSTPNDTWAGAAISTLAPVIVPPTN